MKRPQTVNLELNDLTDLYQRESATESYIEDLEQRLYDIKEVSDKFLSAGSGRKALTMDQVMRYISSACDGKHKDEQINGFNRLIKED